MSRVLAAIRTLFAAERIEDLPARHVEPFRTNVFVWIFAGEELPDPASSARPRRPGFLSWLFRPEELAPPGPGAARPAGRSFLGMLFAREELPRDGKPTGAGGRGGGPPG